jgi:hypothetical protein
MWCFTRLVLRCIGWLNAKAILLVYCIIIHHDVVLGHCCDGWLLNESSWWCWYWLLLAMKSSSRVIMAQLLLALYSNVVGRGRVQSIMTPCTHVAATCCNDLAWLLKILLRWLLSIINSWVIAWWLMHSGWLLTLLSLACSCASWDYSSTIASRMLLLKCASTGCINMFLVNYNVGIDVCSA